MLIFCLEVVMFFYLKFTNLCRNKYHNSTNNDAKMMPEQYTCGSFVKLRMVEAILSAFQMTYLTFTKDVQFGFLNDKAPLILSYLVLIAVTKAVHWPYIFYEWFQQERSYCLSYMK